MDNADFQNWQQYLVTRNALYADGYCGFTYSEWKRWGCPTSEVLRADAYRVRTRWH